VVNDPSFAHGLVGVTLDGRYRLDAVLGEGGMGSVFRATQLAMDRKVAVKLLKPHLTSDQSALERFSREARATRKVDSPHAVKILDFGVTPLGDYYMVLEYLDGRTVQRELEIDGPFAPPRVAHIACQTLHALGAAHAHGLIHRDVKPDNLLLMRIGADGDYTKVLDFGVAKLMQGTAGDPALLALTAAGMVFGTPEFMSPEQALGQSLDGRSDLYSLAATMFVMLTGTMLFEAGTAIEWLTHHARTPPPPLAMVRPELAAYPELDAVLQRCLAKQREQRPATAGEMARLLTELEPALTRSPAGAPPRTASKPNPVRASSYFEVLRDPASTMVPIASARASDTAASSTASTDALAVPGRRRWALWLGGAAVAALIGIAIGLSVQRPGARASSSEPPVRAAAAAGVTGLVIDGGVGPPGPTAAAPDATPATLTDAPRTPAVPARPSIAPRPAAHPAPPPPSAAPVIARSPRALTAARVAEADEHLRAAEDAFQSGKPLRQFAEADQALKANPRSVRAKYLYADALIKSGDLDNGCKALAELKQNATARARARAAGCPGD